MNKAKEFFDKRVKKGHIIVSHNFGNEHGEQFVIYQYCIDSNPLKYYITGDEFDWELAIKLTLQVSAGDFMFNEEELAEIFNYFFADHLHKN
jgi:hypothetical protein